MRLLHLTLLYFMLNAFSTELALEYPPSSRTNISKPISANPTATSDVKPRVANIIFQSKDGGQTWQDISNGLPENEQPEDFFAGESEVYLRVKKVLYRSQSNLITPVWKKEITIDPQSTSIAFNPSGVMAYNYAGQIYQRMPSLGTWLPIYTNFKNQSVETIFETSDGTVLIGCGNGLYKSDDRGRSWKKVLHESINLVESEGILIGTGQKGIMRSADNGEHWEWVISEGGVGIAVERIDGGFAAISYNTTVKSRRISISLDGGKTWNAIDYGLPSSQSISSIKQMGKYLICGHPDGIFRSADMGKTWDIVLPSIGDAFKVSDKTLNSGKVFKLYISGNVLYAVAKDGGC